MNPTDTVMTFTQNDLTVAIIYDHDTPDPHANDDGRSCLLAMTHKRYTWPDDAGVRWDDFDSWPAVADYLRQEHGAIHVETVWGMDHSGISFTAVAEGGDRPTMYDPWDSNVAGLAFITPAIWWNCQGSDWTGSPDDLAKAHGMISGELEQYQRWVNDECYGYVVTDADGEILESEWGLVGLDSATEEAKEAAKAASGKHDKPAYPAPGSDIPDQPGYVVATCGHRMAGSEWHAGLRTCERCPKNT